MNKNIDSSGNHTNVSHSVFDSVIPFIQFVYVSEGIAGVAELYRSVVGNPNTNRPVNSILIPSMDRCCKSNQDTCDLSLSSTPRSIMNRKSTDKHVSNCSHSSHEVCLHSGTTQSLSWPDSALLGAHQFQATALKGKAVSWLLPSSSKVSDNDVTNNKLEFSCDQSFVDGSEGLDDQIAKKGITQSLSPPDSALLGAHQFQATAPTGKVVGSFSDASSSVSNESNLCPKHVNVRDGCMGTSHSYLSSNQSLANGSEMSENEFTAKGTTQSLSQPDSALLGTHQFQATAPTGKAVGLFSDSLSSDSDQPTLCTQLRSDYTNHNNEILSDVSKVKITLKNQQFPEMSFLNQDSSNADNVLPNQNVIPILAGVSADWSVFSNDNDENEFSSDASLSITFDCWDPNCIGKNRTHAMKHHPTPQSTRINSVVNALDYQKKKVSEQYSRSPLCCHIIK